MTCTDTVLGGVDRGPASARRQPPTGIEHLLARWQRSDADSLLRHVSTRRPDPRPWAPPSPCRRLRPAAPPLPARCPTTTWFPGPNEPNAAPIPGAVLPAWAIDKIRTEFVGRPGHRPAPLLKIAIRDTAPGMDARIPSTPFAAAADDEDAANRPSILLAELHPDALPAPAADLPAVGGEMPGAQEDGWPGFFHRAHRLLPHQRHPAAGHPPAPGGRTSHRPARLADRGCPHRRLPLPPAHRDRLRPPGRRPPRPRPAPGRHPAASRTAT